VAEESFASFDQRSVCVRVCGGGSVGTVEIGLVVGGEMQENLNKHLRKGKKVEAFSSKIHLKA
jgi:hypothetical protein